jgi:hypothetical protein
LLVIATRIFALGTLRAARIRSAATIRAAQITAGVVPHHDERAEGALSGPPLATSPGPAISREHDLIQKIEQLRSLIRSAMFTLTTDEQRAEVGPNPYCTRIAQLRFDERDLPANPTAGTVELYKKLLLQLAAVRRTNERTPAQAELSQAHVQLNACAREFAAALSRPPASLAPEQAPNVGPALWRASRQESGSVTLRSVSGTDARASAIERHFGVNARYSNAGSQGCGTANASATVDRHA